MLIYNPENIKTTTDLEALKDISPAMYKTW